MCHEVEGDEDMIDSQYPVRVQESIEEMEKQLHKLGSNGQ